MKSEGLLDPDSQQHAVNRIGQIARSQHNSETKAKLYNQLRNSISEIENADQFDAAYAQLTTKAAQESDSYVVLEKSKTFRQLATTFAKLKHPDALESDALQVEFGQNDDDVQVESVAAVTIDPVTLKEMVDPMRSSKCSHRIGKDALDNLFVTASHNPDPTKRSYIKCPTRGCGGKMTKSDYVPDEEMRAFIAQRALN